MFGAPDQWRLINPEELDRWIAHHQPTPEQIRQVVAFIVRIMNKEPDLGIELPILVGLPQWTAIVLEAMTSVTWCIVGSAYPPEEQGVNLQFVTPAIMP